MSGYTNLSETKLIIPKGLKDTSSTKEIISKINAIIDALNFLDHHVNFLYERSRTQYNTLVAQASGLQNVYDEFQEFKKRFETFDMEHLKNIQIESKRTKLDLIEHQDNN